MLDDLINNWQKLNCDRFLDSMTNMENVLLCYNSDADGLIAGIFVHRILNLKNKKVKITEKAIYNFQYDFQILSEICKTNKYDLIVCVDLPIIQETAIANEVSKKSKLLIYDHHFVLNYEPTKLNKEIVYINSREINEDFPCSYFCGLLYCSLTEYNFNNSLLISAGLSGDWAFDRFSKNKEFIFLNFEKKGIDNQKANNIIQQLTKNINTYFRANPYLKSTTICENFAKNSDKDILSLIKNYNVDLLDELVQKEINFGVENHIHFTGFVLCEILEIKTFSVGVIASILSTKLKNPVFVLGFKYEDKIQFELRTNRDNKINIVEVLKIQKNTFKPLTSGGHPKAAGALIKTLDFNLFKSSFIESLNQYLETVK